MTAEHTFRDWFGRARAAIARLRGVGSALRAHAGERMQRYLRMAGGFALSVIVLGLGALYVSAAAARVPLDADPALSAPAGGTLGLAAAQHLFALQAKRDDIAADRLFAPAALKRREAIAFAAAQEPARAYLALLRVRRGARAPLLLAARSAAEEGGPRAADAVARLNAAAARERIVFDRADAAFRALADEAAAACAARASELHRRMAAPSGDPRLDERAFFAARGEALGWLLVLRAAARDTQPAPPEPALAQLLATLERAAAHDPVFFLSGPSGGAAGPNHLAVIGLDLAVAAEEARALARP